MTETIEEQIKKTLVYKINKNLELALTEPVSSTAKNNRKVNNGLARSGLFTCKRITEETSPMVDRMRIPAPEGVTIFFSGKILTMRDFLTFVELIKLLEGKAPTEQISFSIYELAKLIYPEFQKPGKMVFDRVRNSLRKLVTSTIEIKITVHAVTSTFMGHLIDSLLIQTVNGQEKIVGAKFKPEIGQLFIPERYSTAKYDTIQLLKADPLALKIYFENLTHREPFPQKISTIVEKAGLHYKHLGHAKHRIHQASRLVEKATGWKCLIDNEDKLQITKKD